MTRRDFRREDRLGTMVIYSVFWDASVAMNRMLHYVESEDIRDRGCEEKSDWPFSL